jgi:hypothetical protein
MLEKAGNRTECALLEFAMRLVDQPTGVERIRDSTQILQVWPVSCGCQCLVQYGHL